MDDHRVVIIGDGATGLSAALLLAKTGFDVHVLGTDQTPTRKALLRNFLGLDGMPGPEYMERARAHAEAYGAMLHTARVERVELGPQFRVHADGGVFEADWLVLATGFEQGLAQNMGLLTGANGVQADIDGRTSRDRVYAGGSVTRGMKSQLATSVGDGAAIAVDILSRVKGKPSHDYDVLRAPQKAEAR